MKKELVPWLATLVLPIIATYWDRFVTFNPFAFTDIPHPDVYLPASEIIKNHGYNYEEHYVTTEDGYINMMVRINND